MKSLNDGRAGKSGRKRKDREEIKTLVAQVPKKRRSNYRPLAAAIGVSKTLLLAMKKEGALKRHSQALKPALTTRNRIARLEYILGKMEPDETFFQDYNAVHFDEKWFCLK